MPVKKQIIKKLSPPPKLKSESIRTNKEKPDSLLKRLINGLNFAINLIMNLFNYFQIKDLDIIIKLL